MFVSEGCIKEMPKGGYLHRLRERDPNWKPVEIQRPRKPEPTPPDWNALIAMYCEAVEYEKAKAMADGLGVSVESLDLLDCGYMGGNKWSFPMYDFARHPVGMRTRCEDGTKRSITGSKNGLFIPKRRRDGYLFFVEGPTDCCAVLDIGFDCIGRPACYGCEEWCAELSRGRETVIIADNDKSEVGRAGADKAAKVIRKTARWLKIVYSPYLKDVREWKKNGATRDSLMAVVNCASG